jgi:hypothetical protein
VTWILERCLGRESEKDMKKTWTCEICGHKNPDETDICEECGSYREESSYDAIADEED